MRNCVKPLTSGFGRGLENPSRLSRASEAKASAGNQPHCFVQLFQPHRALKRMVEFQKTPGILDEPFSFQFGNEQAEEIVFTLGLFELQNDALLVDRQGEAIGLDGREVRTRERALLGHF